MRHYPETASLTDCILAWQAKPDDPAISATLAKLVYQHLRTIASARLKNQPGQLFTPTDLVHETWLAIQPPANTLKSRDQFFKLASTIMRNLLVDQARARLAQKRGGDRARVTLSIADQEQGFTDERLLDLDQALENLAAEHPRHAEVVVLRCFGGLKLQEIAQTLDISTATVKRDWTFACAWLTDALRE